MPYDSIVNRTDADALIPEEISREILQTAVTTSAALALFPQIVMSRKMMRLPVVSALPVAYFVNGDTGLKQTTDMAWDKKYLVAEEIAALVPVPQAVLDDATFDMWGSIQARLAEAIGRALDGAVFLGANAPTSWPTGIVAGATTAGNVYVRGTNNTAAGGIAADVSSLFAEVEGDGYDVNGLAANRTYRGRLRNVRDAQGRPTGEITADEAFGVKVTYPLRGLWATGVNAPEMIAGDFTQGILGLRQDITFKLLDQAVISADDGTIMYNLAQQDMVAMRVVARFAFQIANPISYDNTDSATRYPFAVMNAPAT